MRRVGERWNVELLGGEVRATRGTRVVARFRSHKTAGLLAYLAHLADRAHAREHLVETFWPETAPDAGRNNLSKSLTSLRALLEGPGEAGSVIVATRATIALAPGAVSTDVAAFEAALAAADASPKTDRLPALRRAVELYRGDLLPGHEGAWVLSKRDLLRAGFVRLARDLTSELERAHDPHGAIACARRVLAVDPLCEEASRDLMALYDAVGEPASARRVFDELTARLERELGVGPTPETRALAGRTLVPEPPRAESPAPRKIPVELTRFFGREEELARASAWALGSDGRLLTVRGPGGIGKTRFALELLARLGDGPGSAVVFVPLAPLAGAEFLPGALADALGVPGGSGPGVLERVAAKLALEPTVLVLDNFEHLVDGGTSVVRDLLGKVASLRCVVTSRRLLGIKGERDLVLAPLPVPDASGAGREAASVGEGASVNDCASVSLLRDRLDLFEATGAVPDASLARLVRALEGIPLALELAASRLRVLDAEQLLARLGERLSLLASHERDLPERQTTLRASIDGSHDLLSPEQRLFFARASVFRGGFTVEAAEEVLEDPLALDRISELEQASLVTIRRHSSGTRAEMLETIREYAAALLSPEETARVRRRHAAYFAKLTLAARDGLLGASSRTWGERIGADLGNVRAALAFAPTDPAASEDGLAIGANLMRFWDTRLLFAEARRWLGGALAVPGPASSARAQATMVAGLMAVRESDHEAGTRLLETALASFESLGDAKGTAAATANLAVSVSHRGDPAAALPLFEKALALARRIGDSQIAARQLLNVAMIHLRFGDAVAATPAASECLETFRSLDDRIGTLHALQISGRIHNAAGRYDRAAEELEDSLARARALGDENRAIYALLGLARVRLHQRDLPRARSLAGEALALARKAGVAKETALATAELGIVARDEGDPAAARRALDEAIASARGTGSTDVLEVALVERGDLLRSGGEAAAARADLSEALALRGPSRGLDASGLERWAALHELEGDVERAAALEGAAAALLARLGTVLHPREAGSAAAVSASVARKLGPEAHARAVEAGKRLSREEANVLAASLTSRATGQKG